MTDYSNDGSDENDGKYSTESEMTFEGLLKTSLQEHDEHEHIPTETAEVEKQASASKTKTSSSQATETEREDSDSPQRIELANTIGKRFASNQTSDPLAEGKTNAIGHHTTYTLSETTLDEQTYHFLVQVTDQSYRKHKAELVTKEFGTDWSYEPIKIPVDAIRHVIGEQRQRDLRAGKKPIEPLSDDQLETIRDWYQNRGEIAFEGLGERYGRADDDIDVYDQYLMVDLDVEELLLGGDLHGLTERQTIVIRENIFEIVSPTLNIPQSLAEYLQQNADYPVFANILFDG